MFFTSRSQPRIIIPHAARCCKPFFRILPNFFQKIWRMTPLTVDFPPGGGLLFKTCRDFSVFSAGRRYFSGLLKPRVILSHLCPKEKPCREIFPSRADSIHRRPVCFCRQSFLSPEHPLPTARHEMVSMGGAGLPARSFSLWVLLSASGGQLALMPAGAILDPQCCAVPGHAGMFTGDHLPARIVQQTPAVAPAHRHIAVH